MLCEMMIQSLFGGAQLLQGHPSNFKPHMQTLFNHTSSSILPENHSISPCTVFVPYTKL